MNRHIGEVIAFAELPNSTELRRYLRMEIVGKHFLLIWSGIGFRGPNTFIFRTAVAQLSLYNHFPKRLYFVCNEQV